MDVLSGDTRSEVDAGFRALPDPAPLPMPEQPLHAGRHRRTQPPSPPAPAGGEGRVTGAIRPLVLPSSPTWMGLRRLLVLGGAAAMTAGAAYEMYRVLAGSGLTALGAAMVLLFILLFGWIALACTSALAGFCSVLAGGGCRLGTGPDAPLPALSSRTALLMPVYNEQPARVMAALQAIDESLAHLRASEWFDMFVLSDTTEPDIWIEEEAAFLALRDRIGAHRRLFYRRRPHNTARKPGNIAEWVGRFGDAYPQFLILDADSLMTGEALVRLAGAMQRHADVGLIQTLPVIVGGATLLARLQQFAGRVYGPVIAHGIAWWHGAEGNYWGHNAMVRTQAFAACAGLPVLAGRRPFGGPIMSHDFVEAGLLRRGGWAVQMVPGLAGSYEASPPSLIDLAIRDRRWCQGNLQHAAVLPARGLHWISRLHLLTGIGSYVTAPLWLLFLLIGLLIAVQSHFVPFDYFPGGRTLFPRWPQVDPVRARWLFEVAMVVLLAPKVLGLLAALLRGPDRRGCGGAARLIAGAMIETVLAGLIAPVAMLTQTIDVLTILGGRESGWNPQRRDDGRVPPRDVLRRYLPHTLLGVALSLAAFWASPFLALWMLPVSAGLVLAIPLAAITGARTAGAALRRVGLLGIPEERDPPGVLLQAIDLSHAAQQVAS
ncbi:MAG TPA: glucans biosynthesis glucosyltransferase MdoH, partial [Acetobacteraceae bacterium]|nr:glucans biosynthesis glucosyltransferase MdoH [Acetobacteraceae bacterium]